MPPSEHAVYVAEILKAMWNRDTNLHHLQAVLAARLSKAIRDDKMPLPDGRRPSPQEAAEIVRQIRGPARGFTLALVPERWQRAVDELWAPNGERWRTSPPSNAGRHERSQPAGPKPLRIGDLS